MMFRKWKERILAIEVVLELLIELLEEKDVISRGNLQLKILQRADENRREMEDE